MDQQLTAWQTPAGILAHRTESRDHWLGLRRASVTASQAGALMNIHEYTSLYELWAVKRGIYDPAIVEDNPVMLRGELLEDDALELVRRRHPDWRILHNQIPGGLYLEDPTHRLGGTPDAFCLTGDGPGIIQIKTTDPFSFRQKWLDGDVVTPPLWIAVQASLEAYLAGARHAWIAVLSVGRTLDLHMVAVPHVPGLIKRMQKAARAFWEAVGSDTPPEPDYARDAAVLAALTPQDRGTHIDLGQDNEFCAALAERQRLKAEEHDLNTALGRCETLIKHKLGTHATAEAGPYRISYRTQKRKGFVVKETEFRKLTIKGGDDD